jgi:hypothetical protein
MSSKPKQQHQEQGDRLERAIAVIEDAIVKHNPALQSCNHTIESKKQVRVEGVRHELDVYVEYDFGSAKTLFVFECKNRNRRAGKDEVYVLLEKVNAVAAQNGYLVARGFTQSAVAAAKQSRGRIILVQATDYIGQAIDFPQSPVKMRTPLNPTFQILLHCNGGTGRAVQLDLAKLPHDFAHNIKKRGHQLLGAHMLDLDARGVRGRCAQRFRVTESIPAVKIPSGTVASITYLIEYTYVNEPIPTKISARFDVPGRGKYVEFEFTDPVRGPLRVGIGSSEIGDGKWRASLSKADK